MKERILYLDILRIFATFMVIVLHISAQNFGGVSVDSFEWNVFNVFDSTTRWTVPVFVMISGALFLDRNYSVEKIYGKYILRMVTSFVFWSAIYAIFNLVGANSSFKEALWSMLTGPVHMWFLFMIVGLYMIIPIVRHLISSEKIMKYFLVLGCIFTSCIPTLLDICVYICPKLKKLADSILSDMDFHLTIGFVFYFVLGFYLSKADISKKMQNMIYLGGICGLLITIVMTSVISLLTGEVKVDFYGNFTINVLLESVAVFVFFKYKVAIKQTKTNIALITRMSKYSFGVYLVHMLVIGELNEVLKFNTLSFNPILSIPVIAIIVFAVSYIISGILNHIPILKKYVV